MPQHKVRPGHGSSNLPTDYSPNDAGWSALHPPPGQQMTEIHGQGMWYSPDGSLPSYAHVDEQGHPITNTYSAPNQMTSPNEETQISYDTFSYFNEAMSGMQSQDGVSESHQENLSEGNQERFEIHQEQAPQHTKMTPKQPAIPIPEYPDNHEQPWSTVNQRGDQDSPLHGMQHPYFYPFQPNTAGNIPPFPGFKRRHSTSAQDIGQNTCVFSQSNQGTSVKRKGGRLRRLTGDTATRSIDDTSVLSASITTTTTSTSTFSINCPICSECFTGTYSKGNLGRHKRHVHSSVPQSYKCPYKGCGLSYKRTDALRKHYKNKHPSDTSLETTRRQKVMSNQADREYYCLGMSNS